MNQSIKDYWKSVGNKLIENMTSVKVWMFLLPFCISTKIFYTIIKLSEVPMVIDAFKIWAEFNVSIVAAIIVVREIFKVAKIHKLNNGDAKKIQP